MKAKTVELNRQLNIYLSENYPDQLGLWEIAYVFEAFWLISADSRISKHYLDRHHYNVMQLIPSYFEARKFRQNHWNMICPPFTRC